MNDTQPDIQTLEEMYVKAGIALTPDQKQLAQTNLDKLSVLHVTGIEAVKAVVTKLTNSGVAKPAMAPATSSKIDQIVNENQWANLTGKVIQLWDPTHNNISQTGLIGDETGIIKFTIWKTAGVKVTLEEGKVYTMNNIVNNPWNGRHQVSANKTSNIALQNYDIEIKSTDVEYTGFAIALQQGSGLIKRCPECNNALNKGVCGVHGKVDGIYDIRLKLVIDDGTDTHECIADAELTTQFTGITLEAARQIAVEQLDALQVMEEFKKSMGKYVTIKGSQMGSRYINLTEISPAIVPQNVTAPRANLAQAVD